MGNADLFPGNTAALSPELNVTPWLSKFPTGNVIPLPDKLVPLFPNKSAELFPDKPALMFSNKLVPLFPDKCANKLPDPFKRKLANKSPDKPVLQLLVKS